jgi:hypothetical protein
VEREQVACVPGVVDAHGFGRPTIVSDQHNRAFAGRRRLFRVIDRRQVEVVGRLVERRPSVAIGLSRQLPLSCN